MSSLVTRTKTGLLFITERERGKSKFNKFVNWSAFDSTSST